MMLSNKIQDAVHKLREVAEEYAQLSEPEQRQLRHVVYQKTGGFGRILLKDKAALFAALNDEAKKLIDKGKE